MACQLHSAAAAAAAAAGPGSGSFGSASGHGSNVGEIYAPAREFYNGQFVLLPLNLKDTQKFIELTLITPEILLENAQIAVLNGSRISGLASEMAQRLRRLGFHVIETGNYDSDKPVFKSFYEPVSSNAVPKTESFLQSYLEIDPLFSPEEVAETDTELEVADKTVPDPTELVDLNIVLGVTYD